MTDIDVGAFEGCVGLTSVVIPNSVTSIGGRIFEGCIGLTSVTLPNSVPTIGIWAFEGCSSLTSINIPSSVKTIEELAFQNCGSLTSVIIPQSVTFIDSNAFEGTALSTIVSLVEDPQQCKLVYKTFDDETYDNATLYVPTGTKDKYKEAAPWQYFVNIVEGAEGFVGIASVRTNDVQIQSNGSTLIIFGVETGKIINVYDVAGRLVGSASASIGATSFDTSLRSGEIGIVKIGENTIKVVVR